jgi:hypothetical protein
MQKMRAHRLPLLLVHEVWPCASFMYGHHVVAIVMTSQAGTAGLRVEVQAQQHPSCTSTFYSSVVLPHHERLIWLEQ